MVSETEKTYPCSRCNGKGTKTVSREFSHEVERCSQCNGDGVEPERYARQLKLADAIDQMNFWTAGYEWDKNRLRAFIPLSKLPEFYGATSELIGDYRPRLDKVTDVGEGQYRAELLFSPHD